MWAASLAQVALPACLGFLDEFVKRWKVLQFLADWSNLLGNSDCDFADFFRVENQNASYFTADEVSNNRVCVVVGAVLEAHAVLL